MSPIEWALRPFKRYAEFSGRAPRAEYWWYVLAVGVTGLVLGLIDVLVLRRLIYGNYGPLGLVFTLGILVPGLAVLVRRLHDIDRSGWWALVKAPSYGLILWKGSPFAAMAVLKGLGTPLAVILVLAWLGAAFTVFLFTITEGTGDSNRFGPDPYGPDQLEEVFA
jgi:uncharacterized membrane protein YhaH (DUF805 family)